MIWFFIFLLQNLRWELVYTVLFDQYLKLDLDTNKICVIWTQHWWSFIAINVMLNGVLDKHRHWHNFSLSISRDCEDVCSKLIRKNIPRSDMGRCMWEYLDLEELSTCSCATCDWKLNFQFYWFQCQSSLCWSGIRYFFGSLFLLSDMMSKFWDILETYRPIGEMDGRVWETNIFLRVV